MKEEKKSFIDNKFNLCVLPILAIILEILPMGAVLVSEGVRETYSFFSMIPARGGNMWPFITGILTIILLALLLINNFRENHIIFTISKVIAVLAILASFLPNLLGYGLDYFTVVGVCVTVSLIASFVFIILFSKKNNIKKEEK